MIRLSRRRFLELAGATGAAASLPWTTGCGDDATVTEPARFFTSDERRVVEALAAAVVPDDDRSVGAPGTDAVELIDLYLAAFENDPPRIYLGGPYSGRTPYPDPVTGLPSEERPSNDYRNVLPLTRLQEFAFRIELYGSASVPNGDINEPLVPGSPGLRARYRDGIASLLLVVGGDVAAFEALDDAQKLAAFGATHPEFQSAVLRHLAEGMFGAPEYGGNRDERGWRDYHYDGDSQPLGHTLFDANGEPFDHPDRPTRTADPNRPPRSFSPEVESFLEAIAVGQGGRRFF